mmetsp:Transcript_93112/g.170905  ORF Transcript_93112/g.170905 Transcript_93112/m.170905 type:complete len:95 (-) Transcript_93112:175-459(-)
MLQLMDGRLHKAKAAAIGLEGHEQGGRQPALCSATGADSTATIEVNPEAKSKAANASWSPPVGEAEQIGDRAGKRRAAELGEHLSRRPRRCAAG